MTNPSLPRLLVLLLVLSASTPPLGAGPALVLQPASPKERRQDQIGSTHLSVVSVGRWEDYKQALQPKFDLKPGDALAGGISDSMLSDKRTLDALGLRLGLAFPGMAADGTKVPGDTTGLESGADVVGDRKAGSLPGITGSSISGFSVNPMLRYWAATALYQEVQLLNRYVLDAAYDPEREEAFLVRLQVTLMPYTRDAAYDAWTSLAFFAGDFPTNRTNRGSTALAKESAERSSLEAGVRVLPMLVTDDLEALVQNQTEDRIRGLSLALSAMLGKVGASLGVDRLREDLNQAMGRDLNSLFTVGRFTDNTVRCRFGARLQPKSGYAMVAQTHAVTLLVLVPKVMKPDEALRVVAKTEFRNARTGGLTGRRPSAEYYLELLEPLSRYGLNSKALAARKSRDIQTLRSLCKNLATTVAANDFEGFKLAVDQLVCVTPDSVIYYESLWADVASVRAGNNFSSAVLRLPKAKVPTIFPDQPLILQDNGKTQAVLQLLGQDLTAVPVKLQLNLAHNGWVAYPVGLSVAPDGSSLTARFGSLVPLGWNTGTPPDAIQVRISLSTNSPVVRSLARYVVAKSEEPRTFEALMPARVLVARNGVGRFSISLHGLKADTKVSFKVSGADISKAEAAAKPGQSLAFEKGAWLAAQDGLYWFDLANLAPGHPVEIALGDGASTSSNFVLAVVDAPLDQ